MRNNGEGIVCSLGLTDNVSAGCLSVSTRAGEKAAAGLTACSVARFLHTAFLHNFHPVLTSQPFVYVLKVKSKQNPDKWFYRKGRWTVGGLLLQLRSWTRTKWGRGFPCSRPLVQKAVIESTWCACRTRFWGARRACRVKRATDRCSSWSIIGS